ncbi:hypothetical protein PG993_012640 [Apiospora rasikravindrae]|uniref:Uncharacterized protein n=1 Tax=Apiospora rasikravindrae TaxID=990691 RepID=A0ABR1S5A6_9PEZI
MQILKVFRPFAFLFAVVSTTLAGSGFAQADADADHHNIWAKAITAGPAAPTAPPEIIAAAAAGSSIPVTVNPALKPCRGWLRDPANYGRFNIRGDQWDKKGRDYLHFLWTDHCAFGAFRTDFQPEDLMVGAFDVADLIDMSVKHFSSPYLNPPRVEADGFMYCQEDIPFGWGLYNKFANQQNQFDVD